MAWSSTMLLSRIMVQVSSQGTLALHKRRARLTFCGVETVSSHFYARIDLERVLV
jgi:hypothetical protein